MPESQQATSDLGQRREDRQYSDRGGSQLPRRLSSLALAGFALVLCGVVVARSRFTVDGESQFTLVDDAMISMRYARNLAHGHGLVWNIGEPPIEGFTNLGYTLLMVPGFVFGDNVFTRYLVVGISTAGLAVSVLLTAALTRAIWPGSCTAPVVAGVMVALDFGLVFWASQGMEVSLVTAAILAMALQLIRWRDTRGARSLWWAAILGSAAIVLRLDSLAVVLTMAVWLVACEFYARRSIRDALVIPGVALGSTVVILVFQAGYFADAMPNTYRLKVEGVSPWERITVGWEVFVQNAAPQLLVLFVMGPLLLACCSFSTLRRGNTLLLVAIAATSIAYSVLVGGDYAEPQVHAPNRFILVGIPSLCVLAAAGAAAAAARIRVFIPTGAVAPVLGVVAIAIALTPNFDNLRLLTSREIPLLADDQRRTALGLHLKAALPPDATIATHAAGEVPYYSKLRTIDLLGKSDRHIAAMPQTATRFRPGHNKWDYDYGITELAPDVVADEWGTVDTYLKSHGGYLQLPNGLWVSKKPKVPIDNDALGACYWQCE